MALPEKTQSYRLGSKFLPGCVAVLAAFSVFFLVALQPAAGEWMAAHLVLVPGLAFGKQPWRFVTGPLLVQSPFTLLFLFFLMWSVGAAIEQRIGARRMVLFGVVVLFVASFTAGVCGLCIGWLAKTGSLRPTLMEAGPIFSMCFLAFGKLYGGLTMKLWGVPQTTSGRTLAWFFIGVGLVAHLLRGEWELLCADIVTLVVTAALLRNQGGRPVLVRPRSPNWLN